MEFQTQQELLEYLGKNVNSRHLVQRMIARWEVIKEWRLYILVDKESRVRELEKELELYKECYEKNKVDYNNLLDKYNELKEGSSTSSDVELEEAKIQREYYRGLYEEEKADKDFRIRKAFSWIKQIKPKADWDEFYGWLMSDED